MTRVATICVLLAGAGCAFHRLGEEPVDPTLRTLIDDTATDFAGARLAGAVVHPRGAIEPETFAIGGLALAAYDRVLVASGNIVTWEQLAATLATLTPTGGQLGSSIDTTYQNRPFGAGLFRDDDFTLVYSGEIFLDGQRSLSLASDGPGMVQIDVARDGSYAARLYDEVPQPDPTLVVTPPGPGWYPIRAAFTDTTGPAVFQLRDAGSPIPGARLRASTTALGGLVVQGFDDPRLTAPAGTGLETHDLARDFTIAAPPYDFALLTFDTYGMRLAGQLLIETAGTYRIAGAVDAADSMRIFVDGKLVASRWATDDPVDASPPLALDAGWHDLAVDVADAGGPSRFAIELVEAPPGVALGAITARQIRPVVRFGTVAAIDSLSVFPLPDGSPFDINLAPAVPDGAIVQRIDVGYALNHTAPVQITTRLVHPDGTPDMLRASDATVRPADFFGARGAFAGKPAGGMWKLRVEDGAVGQTGTVGGVFLVVGYRAAIGPIGTAATFASRPRPLPGARTIEAVRAIGALPTGADVAIAIRTCATEAGCGDAPWQPFDAGAAPIAADAFVEYRLELASDGWALPIIDAIEIDYRIAP